MTLIIAEAGVNHNGNIQTAYQLIEEAATAGADIVKFQSFKADLLATPSASKASYQQMTTSNAESQFSMLKKLELKEDIHPLLIDHSKKCGIEFLSTPFDILSIDFLSSLNLCRWKIPSGEIAISHIFVILHDSISLHFFLLAWLHWSKSRLPLIY